MAVFMTLFFGDEHRKQKMSTTEPQFPRGRQLRLQGNFSEKSDFSAQRRCSGWVYFLNDGQS
jgi:hypothetical protein